MDNMDYNRKDCKPEITIKKIKEILKRKNIKVKQSKFSNLDNKIFSVRLILKDFPKLGSNGKGITKKYALASAYAELLERLQSGNLLKNHFLNKYNNEKIIKYNMNYKTFVNTFKNQYFLKEDNVKKVLENNSRYRLCEKCYNYFENKYENMPINLINIFTHSNGLCAGNSEKEAIVQGICEIFERYSYKKIMYEELELPNIIIENFKDLKVYEQLLEIENMGYSYIIKDCSLNGKFPVVGLLIKSNQKKYLFSIGSDPDFSIALQRCITEIFQGIKNNIEIKNKFKDYNDYYELQKKKYGKQFVDLNWLKCYTSNNGIHPIKIFESDKMVKLNDLPFTTLKTNEEAFEKIIKITQKNNLKLYIKDYSVMGFPTYKIYIPLLSHIDSIDKNMAEILSNYDYFKNIYYNLYSTINVDCEKFEKIFNELSKSFKYSTFFYPSILFGVNNFSDKNYFKLNYFYILLIELLINKKYEIAEKYINERLLNKNIDICEFLYLKEVNTKIKSINNNIKKINIKKDIDYLIDNPIKYLRKIGAVNCPDCKKCNNKNCKFNKWEILIKKVYDFDI